MECLEGKHVSYFCMQPTYIIVSCRTHLKQGDSDSNNLNSGRVYGLDDKQVKKNNLITGTCYLNQNPLVVMFDTRASYSFISSDCVLQLNISLYELPFTLAVTIEAKNQMETSLVCPQCLTSLFDEIFLVDLICFPLNRIDIILAVDLMLENFVTLICHGKQVIILPSIPQPEQP